MKNSTTEQDRATIGFDKAKLDIACERQAALAQKWGEKLADAVYDLDQLKANKDVVQAEVELRIRNDPDTYGIDGKLTEATVKAQVEVDPDYKIIVMQCNTKKHKVGIYQAQVNAIEHQKRMIEKEIDLYGMGYFAKPKISDPDRERVQKSGRDETFARGRKDRG